MKFALGLLTFVILAAAAIFYLDRPYYVRIAAELPESLSNQGFSHEDFEALLSEYVDNTGAVDYESWHESATAIARLESYLAAVGRYSPDNAPERFPDDNARLAYWMYGYNAYVIRSVLRNWPIGSVTDLRAPLELVKGLGFFHRLRFEFGGTYYSLLAVENGIIRKRFHDPRIHFVLNCASESCPVVRPKLPSDDDLEALLKSATIDFISDPVNVAIDHNNRRIILSTIFKWFKRDFLNDLTRRGLPSEHGLLDYIASVAPDPLRQELRESSDYDIVFADYDWSLNDVSDTSPVP